MMSDYTKCKFVVAGQYPSGLWNLYYAADDFAAVKRSYEMLSETGNDRYKAAAIFTREQWNGRRDSYRYHINLRDRGGESIPAAAGMWLINQADGGYF